MPFKLFTTLRYDPLLLKAHNNPSFTHAGWNYTHRSPCYMLDLHRDRILRAATYWHWAAVLPLLSGSPGLTTLETAIDAFLGSPCRGGDDARAYRLRVLVNEQAELKFEKADEAPRPLEALFPSALSAEKAGDGGPGRGPAFDVVLDRGGDGAVGVHALQDDEAADVRRREGAGGAEGGGAQGGDHRQWRGRIRNGGECYDAVFFEGRDVGYAAGSVGFCGREWRRGAGRDDEEMGTDERIGG